MADLDEILFFKKVTSNIWINSHHVYNYLGVVVEIEHEIFYPIYVVVKEKEIIFYFQEIVGLAHIPVITLPLGERKKRSLTQNIERILKSDFSLNTYHKKDHIYNINVKDHIERRFPELSVLKYKSQSSILKRLFLDFLFEWNNSFTFKNIPFYDSISQKLASNNLYSAILSKSMYLYHKEQYENRFKVKSVEKDMIQYKNEWIELLTHDKSFSRLLSDSDWFEEDLEQEISKIPLKIDDRQNMNSSNINKLDIHYKVVEWYLRRFHPLKAFHISVNTNNIASVILSTFFVLIAGAVLGAFILKKTGEWYGYLLLLSLLIVGYHHHHYKTNFKNYTNPYYLFQMFYPSLLVSLGAVWLTRVQFEDFLSDKDLTIYAYDILLLLLLLLFILNRIKQIAPDLRLSKRIIRASSFLGILLILNALLGLILQYLSPSGSQNNELPIISISPVVLFLGLFINFLISNRDIR